MSVVTVANTSTFGGNSSLGNEADEVEQNQLDPQFAIPLEMVSEAIEAAPDESSLYIERSGIFMRAGVFEEAREDLCTSHQLAPRDTEVDFRVAELHMELGSADTARVYINRYLDNSFDARGLFLRAELNMLQEKPVAATNDFLQALELEKEVQARHYIALAKTILKVNPLDYDRALGWIRHGKTTMGVNEDLGAYELDLMVAKGDLHGAIHLTDELLKEFSSSPKILYRKGQLLEETAMPSSAEKCYRVALEIIRSKGDSRLDTDGLAAVERSIQKRLRDLHAMGY